MSLFPQREQSPALGGGSGEASAGEKRAHRAPGSISSSPGSKVSWSRPVCRGRLKGGAHFSLDLVITCPD